MDVCGHDSDRHVRDNTEVCAVITGLWPHARLSPIRCRRAVVNNLRLASSPVGAEALSRNCLDGWSKFANHRRGPDRRETGSFRNQVVDRLVADLRKTKPLPDLEYALALKHVGQSLRGVR